MYDKPIVIYIQWWKVEAFWIISGIRQGYLLSQLLFNIVLKVLDKAIKATKQKSTQIAKEVKFIIFI